MEDKELRQEYNAYLKIMEGYKNFDKTVKCRHGKAKTQTAFKQLEDSNLEIAEVICLECKQFIGFVYRSMKAENILDTQKLPLEILEKADRFFTENNVKLQLEKRRIKTTAKFIVYAEDKNDYTIEKRRV